MDALRPAVTPEKKETITMRVCVVVDGLLLLFVVRFIVRFDTRVLCVYR